MEQSFFIMETTRKSGSRTNTLKKQKSPRNNDFNGLLVFQFFSLGYLDSNNSIFTHYITSHYGILFISMSPN